MEKSKLFYLKDEHGHIVACVASAITTPKSPAIKPLVVFSLSTHNPTDRFEKRIGRDIATARLNGGRYAGAVDAGVGVKRRILDKIINGKEPKWFPQRAKEAAALWLKNNPQIPSQE